MRFESDMRNARTTQNASTRCENEEGLGEESEGAFAGEEAFIRMQATEKNGRAGGWRMREARHTPDCRATNSSTRWAAALLSLSSFS
jgi:hypothetical protein